MKIMTKTMCNKRIRTEDAPVVRALEVDQSWSHARQQSSCTTLDLVSPPVSVVVPCKAREDYCWILLDAAPLRCRRGEREWSAQTERRNSFKQENL
jgi:hypothetical protein